jgi:coproporphyrinogen III oxidase-like Fe-S oxidoreductase
LFEKLNNLVEILPETEITIECDPGTFDEEYVKGLK